VGFARTLLAVRGSGVLVIEDLSDKYMLAYVERVRRARSAECTLRFLLILVVEIHRSRESMKYSAVTYRL
jgi:hypothetical protein